MSKTPPKNKSDMRGYIDSKGRVRKGRTKTASKLNVRRAEEFREDEKGTVLKDANVEVGNFVSELTTAIRYRETDGLDSGDWIEEPERTFTDGLIFGEETKAATEGKLQITVSLDASYSMWKDWLMESAAPTFRALDRMLREAQVELPPGTLAYAPFVFHGQGFRIPSAYCDHFTQNAFKVTSRYAKDSARDSWSGREKVTSWETYETRNFFRPSPTPSYDLMLRACKEGFFQVEGVEEMTKVPGYWESKGNPKLEAFQEQFSRTCLDWTKDHPLFGEDTLLASLLEAIETWEQGNDHAAARLDIIITDGKFESEADLARANQIQERRNGQLTTVLLNFLRPEYWSTAKLPDRCLQCPVDKENIGASIRNTIMEAVATMML